MTNGERWYWQVFYESFVEYLQNEHLVFPEHLAQEFQDDVVPDVIEEEAQAECAAGLYCEFDPVVIIDWPR